jgi:hypothetical protein
MLDLDSGELGASRLRMAPQEGRGRAGDAGAELVAV